MLILTRKRSEMIRIGEEIVIKVIHTGKSTVKIGIEAPSDVRVLRSELCEQPAVPAPMLAGTTLADCLRSRRSRVEEDAADTAIQN